MQEIRGSPSAKFIRLMLSYSRFPSSPFVLRLLSHDNSLHLYTRPSKVLAATVSLLSDSSLLDRVPHQLYDAGFVASMICTGLSSSVLLCFLVVTKDPPSISAQLLTLSRATQHASMGTAAETRWFDRERSRLGVLTIIIVLGRSSQTSRCV